MSKIQSPQQKKQAAYARDHNAKSKYDKARNGWRIKKQKARRSHRHAVDSLTKAAAQDGESDSKIPAVPRRRVRRWSVPSLGEQVAHKLEKRARGHGARKQRRQKRLQGA